MINGNRERVVLELFSNLKMCKIQGFSLGEPLGSSDNPTWVISVSRIDDDAPFLPPRMSVQNALRVFVQNALRVSIQIVSVCTGTTRTC